MDTNEADPAQPLDRREINDESGPPSRKEPVLDGDDANHQTDDLISSLAESEAAEHLDQLGDILDIIDPLVPLGETGTLGPVSQDTIESHAGDGGNAELTKVDQTGHDSVYLRCRGGLADNTHQATNEGYLTHSTSDPDGVNIVDAEDPDLARFVEYSPYPSPDPSEHWTNEFPWRTWSEDSTLNGFPSIHENNGSQHSQDTDFSDFMSDDEDEEQRGQLPRARPIDEVPEPQALSTRDEARDRVEEFVARSCRAQEAEERGEGPINPAPHVQRSRRERRQNDSPGEQDDYERNNEDLEEALRRSLGFDSPSGRVISIAHTMEIIAEEDRERMAYLEPPAPPYDGIRNSNQPISPPAQPPRPTPSQTPSQPQPQENLQVLRGQMRTDLPTHVLQSLANIGEGSMRSLPTGVLALLGGAEVVGRVMVREVREVARFLLQRREELRARERED
ncbi:MAG: hypothetical protein Q9198_002438 [Flavoplaca austrocitrina]